MQLASMNVFYSIWLVEYDICSKGLSLFWDFFNRHIAVFFETSVLKEVRILHYFHNNNTVLIPKFENIGIVCYTYTWYDKRS